MKEMVGGCCVCSDERGWDENPLVYCDGHGCNVAVHQGTLILPLWVWCNTTLGRVGSTERTDSIGSVSFSCIARTYRTDSWYFRFRYLIF